MSDFFRLFEKCELCPRKCGVNRNRGERGYCNSGTGFEIASVCIHHGEEPPLSGKKGICNVFFPHCNLQCVYCQNHQISDNNSHAYKVFTLERITGDIAAILDKGINTVGFVSPTHYLPQVVAIIDELNAKGYRPVTVWNSNGYELPEIIELLDGCIGVFMPDFKYSDNELAARLSDAPGYPDTALTAIAKMKEMTGTRLLLDDEGMAYRGILIRHLILPGQIRQSCNVLKLIAEKISPRIPVSLMSQYYPRHRCTEHCGLTRTLTEKEYAAVKKVMLSLDLTGWLQEPDSSGIYLPDFNKTNPFNN